MISTYLAERLNISNVLQTNIVEMVMTDMGLDHFYNYKAFNEELQEEDLISSFQTHCKKIRKGVSTDINKCFIEGKAVIIEGYAIDPSLYVEKETDHNTEREIKPTDAEKIPMKCNYSTLCAYNEGSIENDVYEMVFPELNGDSNVISKSLSQEKKGKPENFRKGIVVPIILSIRKSDHMDYIENRLNYKEDKCLELLEKYQKIQKYLLSQNDRSIIVPINIEDLEETVELIHEIVLNKINASYKRKDFSYPSFVLFWLFIQ